MKKIKIIKGMFNELILDVCFEEYFSESGWKKSGKYYYGTIDKKNDKFNIWISIGNSPISVYEDDCKIMEEIDFVNDETNRPKYYLNN